MIVISCEHSNRHRHGKNRCGNQRYKCALCGKTFVEPTTGPLGEMRTLVKRAAMALSLLLEGMSIRSTERLTGICRKTLCDLILQVGRNCQRFLQKTVKGVNVTEVEVDELHSFTLLREKKRVVRGYDETVGDCWCFVAVERNNKLILAHKVGRRDNVTCLAFLQRLAKATAGRFQLSSDGLAAYRLNVPFTLGSRVDFGVLIKQYASQQEVTRYAPATIISAERRVQFGNPDVERITTSHSEVLNRQFRMSLRRYTRLTNAHSKSRKHHKAMVAIFVAFYNFVRPHETLKGKTPAMAAGLADKKWTIRQLLERTATL